MDIDRAAKSSSPTVLRRAAPIRKGRGRKAPVSVRWGIGAVGLLLLAGCAGGPLSGQDGASRPLVERWTPGPDMVTVTLPPGEPRARAGSIARMSCPMETSPVLHAVSGQRFVYRCIGVL